MTVWVLYHLSFPLPLSLIPWEAHQVTLNRWEEVTGCNETHTSDKTDGLKKGWKVCLCVSLVYEVLAVLDEEKTCYNERKSS